MNINNIFLLRLIAVAVRLEKPAVFIPRLIWSQRGVRNDASGILKILMLVYPINHYSQYTCSRKIWNH